MSPMHPYLQPSECVSSMRVHMLHFCLGHRSPSQVVFQVLEQEQVVWVASSVLASSTSMTRVSGAAAAGAE